MNDESRSATAAVAHLQPGVWAKVNRLLAVKAIAEFAHELLLRPEPLDSEGAWTRYRVESDVAGVVYEFRAQRLALDHWYLDKSSLCRLVAGQEDELDALRLIVDLHTQLGIREEMLAEYLQEVASTLYAAAYKHGREGLSALALTHADFQRVETSMSEGHPIFVANNARLGFTADDYLRYAPELAAPTALVWLAARKLRADFACVQDLSYEALVREELSPSQRAHFARILEEQGLCAEDYLWLPVHPWQWQNRIALMFAPDLAARDLVYLGVGDEPYLAQQSIRTFFNLGRPEQRYVKTSLSILNMGFTRGMSPSLAASAAAVNDWVAALVKRDDYLQRLRFSLLREVAFIGYRQRHFEAACKRRSDPYKELLAVLWRESPITRARPGERLMTMAALMHIDNQGVALLPMLIGSSGQSIDAWLRAYLHHYLKPLLHAFYAHHLLFTPHCENTILVLSDNLPVAVLMKDLAEDIGVVNPEHDLPESVRQLALRVPEELMTLGIFTDVFDCVFRLLAQILYEHAQYPEQRFWRAVAQCIREYQKEQPQFAAKYRRYDLFAPTFARNCLNRLQLHNNRQMVDLNAPEPVDSLQMMGELDNPIAAFALERELDAPREEHHETV